MTRRQLHGVRMVSANSGVHSSTVLAPTARLNPESRGERPRTHVFTVKCGGGGGVCNVYICEYPWEKAVVGYLSVTLVELKLTCMSFLSRTERIKDSDIY